MGQFSVSLVAYGHRVQHGEALQEIRGATEIRMHVTCQKCANRMRRHLYPDHAPLSGMKRVLTTRKPSPYVVCIGRDQAYYIRR